MTKLDWLFIVLMGIGLIRGWTKGAIKQLVSLAALILGAYVAISFYHPVGLWLSVHFHLAHQTAIVFAFVSLFVACALVLFIVGQVVSAFFKMMAMGWLNRFTGAAIGVLKVALLIGIVLQLYALLPMSQNNSKSCATHSFLYQTLATFPSKVLPFVHFNFLENQKKNQ